MIGQHDPGAWRESYWRQQVSGLPGHVAAWSPATIPVRKILISGAIVTFVIVAAIIGHAVASGNSIAVGDCVVTHPGLLSGWDIKKVACNSNPGSAPGVQQWKVVSVQNGANGQCEFGQVAFQDDPASKTYCLADYFFGVGG